MIDFLVLSYYLLFTSFFPQNLKALPITNYQCEMVKLEYDATTMVKKDDPIKKHCQPRIIVINANLNFGL